MTKSADAPAASRPDVDAIEAKWLQMCGYCDGGIQTACRCPDEDHRAVISDLVAEVRRLRGDSEPSQQLSHNDGGVS